MVPYKLKKGDTIGVVSSSEPITEERIIDIESSTKFFEGLGLKVKLGKYLKNKVSKLVVVIFTDGHAGERKNLSSL